jgi:hypothetical protein
MSKRVSCNWTQAMDFHEFDKIEYRGIHKRFSLENRTTNRHVFDQPKVTPV